MCVLGITCMPSPPLPPPPLLDLKKALQWLGWEGCCVFLFCVLGRGGVSSCFGGALCCMSTIIHREADREIRHMNETPPGFAQCHFLFARGAR